MTEHTEKNGDNTETVGKKSRRISFIWLVPLMALICTVLLIWQNSLNVGKQIELMMDSADGIEAGKTLVKVRSVVVGRVESVELSDNYERTIVNIRMNADTDDLLNADTEFWVVRPRIENTSVSGLDTLLSGAYIQLLKGKSKEMSDKFECLKEAPVTVNSQEGLTLELNSSLNKRLENGDPVIYKGFTVGSVIKSNLNPEDGSINYRIFIASPYDKLVNSYTAFWLHSGVDLTLNANGLNLETDSFNGLLQGGIMFDDFGIEDGDAVENDTKFELFKNSRVANIYCLNNLPKYVVLFDKDLESIDEGSVVLFKKTPIGEVIAAPWFENKTDIFKSTEIHPVLLAINIDEERDTVTDILDKELADGNLCATFYEDNLITGANGIELDYPKDGEKCYSSVKKWRDVNVIPVVPYETFSARWDSLTKKISAIDYEGISTNLRDSLDSLNKLLKSIRNISDRVNDSGTVDEINKNLKILSQTLNSIKKTSDGFSGDDSVVNSLNEVMERLNYLLKEVSPAVREIGQRPSSIIYGNSGKDPEPRARK